MMAGNQIICRLFEKTGRKCSVYPEELLSTIILYRLEILVEIQFEKIAVSVHGLVGVRLKVGLRLITAFLMEKLPKFLQAIFQELLL
jgi:hypothetical protein